MNQRIYKFLLPMEDEPVIQMPAGAKVLSVQVQRGEPFVWALVDANQRKMARHYFFVLGTGNPIDFEVTGTFLGTIQLHGGDLVFHVWDNGEVG